ncbi:uncharacterized protein H6S33_005027 [Morchella sextelata]|uniref:uncharacterized protein n=1 Tax=Morchella sextelata TaxID=1174677 RepID=UPI001D040C2E|nr:uncharacterized protein H6S33_005027 [Morchella sextelata]KAH0605045.1 hypothetical protein H6S33_005027 [Morchella sextelata]
MGVKGDFKAVNPASSVNVTAAKKDISVETAPKRDYKDDVIEDLNCDLKKLQKSLTCVICLEMLFEPYTLQCGHVFCYTCMLDWLDQAHKMTCPECRSIVKVQPAPAYLIKDMIEVFVLRAELTSPNGNGLELRKQQQEALKAVERDKASEGTVKGGLFRGLFKGKKKDPRVVRDPGDGVLRCPRCNWEIEDGYRNRICEHCGGRFRRLSRYGDFSDDDDDDDDEDEDEDDEDDDEDDSGSETDTDHERRHPLFESSDENELDEDDWDADDAIHMFARNHFQGQFDDDEDEEDENEHDDEEEDEEDHRNRMRDSSESTTGGRDEPIILEDGSDTDEATRNVQRPPRVVPQARRRASHRTTNHTETSEDEGSLEDFIEHDTPEVRRGRPVPGRNGAGTRNIFNNSPVVISSSPAIIAPTRRNARRTVIDDEEEDNQSSVSEASSTHSRRDYSQRRGPIALPSDNDDDLETLGHNMGYTPLDYTASENEDDSFVSPSSGGGNHTNVASHNTGSGSVFSVPEEDEENDEDDESRAFGDDDESEDQDGDVRMGGNEQRRRIPSSQRAVRNRTRGSRPHVIEDDSENDSDAPTTRRRRIQAAGSMSNYRPGETSSSRNWASRRQREIVPAFLNMFQQHSQAMTEGRLESLGSMNPSVSPARSATPVQRNYTGGSSSRATRSTRESTRESREPTRELTPVQAMGQGSPPPPFSPMFQGISSSLASNSPVPNSPAPSNSQMQSPRLGAEARTGSEGGSSNQTSLQSPRPVPITIGASPQASRMRTRNSRQQLRGTTSRSGPRLGSATTTPNTSQPAQLQGVTSTAAAHGRQQGARPILTAAASRSRRGIPLTAEDIRARGEAMIRRQRQEAAESANGLGRRSSRRNLSSSTTNGNGSSAPVPLVAVGRIGSNTLQGNGRRVGAVIGGAPGQGAGGGPMLIIDNGDE